jgi:hypothetical protein
MAIEMLWGGGTFHVSTGKADTSYLHVTAKTTLYLRSDTESFRVNSDGHGTVRVFEARVMPSLLMPGYCTSILMWIKNFSSLMRSGFCPVRQF